MITTDYQPEAHIGQTCHRKEKERERTKERKGHIPPTLASLVLGHNLLFPVSCKSCVVWLQSLFCTVLVLWH